MPATPGGWSVVLPAVPTSAGAARRAALRQLHAHGVVGSPVDAVVLVVSELVTNALRHSGGHDLELMLDIGPTTVSVGVRDSSSATPVVVEAYDGGGRGMVVVAALSTRWHTALEPGGKVVWAHLGR